MGELGVTLKKKKEQVVKMGLKWGKGNKGASWKKGDKVKPPDNFKRGFDSWNFIFR